MSLPRPRPAPPPPTSSHLGGVSRYDKMPPRGIGRWLWKKGVLIDAQLCFSMFEWWEALIMALVTLPITLFFWYSVYKYFPGHIEYLVKRYSYYVYGDENVDLLACTRAYVAEWLNLAWLWVCSFLPTSPSTATRVDL